MRSDAGRRETSPSAILLLTPSALSVETLEVMTYH
jgi:hypothetical protein